MGIHEAIFFERTCYLWTTVEPVSAVVCSVYLPGLSSAEVDAQAVCCSSVVARHGSGRGGCLSSCARILEECSTIHFSSEFFFFFLSGD